mmetsp:Transcript_91027/g.281523  ORF Transcript_91027/g.281523 Transcript_91027/m.281523 type:complete len:303 (+) Transcript_91027:127-1035(+)
MWGRNDGVPLLMRVVHVMQLKVSSPDTRLKGKFLCNTWVETVEGAHKDVNRLMSAKLSTRKVPFDEALFLEETKTTIFSLMGYFVDVFFRFDPKKLPDVSCLERSKVSVHRTELVDHHVDVDLSTTYRGLCTLYHLYTISVVVDGLPQGDFATLQIRQDPGKTEPRIANAMGWCWVTWPQCLDMIHSRQRDMEEKLSMYGESLRAKTTAVSAQSKAIEELTATLSQLRSSSSLSKAALKECAALEAMVAELRRGCQEMTANMEHVRIKASEDNIRRTVPPSIVSELAEKSMVSDDRIQSRNI